MSAPPELDRVEITSAEELRTWLDHHHARDDSVLLVTWKAARRDRYVSRDEVLEELLAHGWVDGRRYTLDEERTMQLIGPRRQHLWTETYRARAERLVADGRMHRAGLAAIEAAKAAGTWEGRTDVDRLEDPGDLVAALEQRSAIGWWVNAAPSYRRNVLRWIASAKRDETRAKRIATVADHAGRGAKVPNY